MTGEPSRPAAGEDLVYQGCVHRVSLARTGQLTEERDAGRDAIRAERALQPGRITQLADGDRDRAVSLPGYRPGRQLDAGLMAGLVTGREQRGHGHSRPGGHGQRCSQAGNPPPGAYRAAAAHDLLDRGASYARR